jgi:hypothetical protein
MQSLAVALVMLWKRDIKRSSSEVSLISVIFSAASLSLRTFRRQTTTATTISSLAQ